MAPSNVPGFAPKMPTFGDAAAMGGQLLFPRIPSWGLKDKEMAMKSKILIFSAAAIIGASLALPASGGLAHESSTCHDAFGSGIEVHGQHIVGDYVTGLGGIFGDGLEWPPKGQ